jgi:hypothetical protein
MTVNPPTRCRTSRNYRRTKLLAAMMAHPSYATARAETPTTLGGTSDAERLPGR